MDPLLRDILSDLLVNIGAGGFGAAIIIPIFSKRTKFRWISLTTDILFGIVSIILAYFIRKYL